MILTAVCNAAPAASSPRCASAKCKSAASCSFATVANSCSSCGPSPQVLHLPGMKANRESFGAAEPAAGRMGGRARNLKPCRSDHTVPYSEGPRPAAAVHFRRGRTTNPYAAFNPDTCKFSTIKQETGTLNCHQSWRRACPGGSSYQNKLRFSVPSSWRVCIT